MPRKNKRGGKKSRKKGNLKKGIAYGLIGAIFSLAAALIAWKIVTGGVGMFLLMIFAIIVSIICMFKAFDNESKFFGFTNLILFLFYLAVLILWARIRFSPA